MSQTNTYTTADGLEPPLCSPFQHLWREDYDGYTCAVCAVFIPVGGEPWAPLDDEEMSP